LAPIFWCFLGVGYVWPFVGGTRPDTRRIAGTIVAAIFAMALIGSDPERNGPELAAAILRVAPAARRIFAWVFSIWREIRVQLDAKGMRSSTDRKTPRQNRDERQEQHEQIAAATSGRCVRGRPIQRHAKIAATIAPAIRRVSGRVPPTKAIHQANAKEKHQKIGANESQVRE